MSEGRKYGSRRVYKEKFSLKARIAPCRPPYIAVHSTDLSYLFTTAIFITDITQRNRYRLIVTVPGTEVADSLL